MGQNFRGVRLSSYQPPLLSSEAPESGAQSCPQSVQRLPQVCASISNHLVKRIAGNLLSWDCMEQPVQVHGACLGDLGSTGLATPANHIWSGQLQKQYGCQSRQPPFPLPASSAQAAWLSLS